MLDRGDEERMESASTQKTDRSRLEAQLKQHTVYQSLKLPTPPPALLSFFFV